MLLDIIFLICGLILLVAGGHFLVNAGVSAAQKFKIAPFIVGATVVAFGTSAPELLVSLEAAFSGHSEMALGNVVGSNIANIALVLGTTACILTLPVLSKRLFRDWLLVIVSSVLLILFCYNGTISSLEGSLLFLILALFIYSAIKSPKLDDDDQETAIYSKWSIIILVFVGSGLALALGAKLLVTGASNIASLLGLSERIISITIVAFGTSLPELATSVIAAIKKQTDISIGNIIGSNLFNILAVLGITAMVKPIHIQFADFRYDLIFMLGTSLLLFFLIYPYKKRLTKHQTKDDSKWYSLTGGKLNYMGGICLLLVYAIYIYSLFA